MIIYIIGSVLLEHLDWNLYHLLTGGYKMIDSNDLHAGNIGHTDWTKYITGLVVFVLFVLGIALAKYIKKLVPIKTKRFLDELKFPCLNKNQVYLFVQLEMKRLCFFPQLN